MKQAFKVKKQFERILEALRSKEAFMYIPSTSNGHRTNYSSYLYCKQNNRTLERNFVFHSQEVSA